MEKFSISSILLLIVFSCNGQAIYWEDLPESQKTQIIDFVSSEIVLQHLNGKIKLSDDSLTFVLLNELSNPNDTLLPLYFYLFNKILEKSDGALSEMVVDYCLEFLVKHTEFVFFYFDKYNDEQLMNVYALMIGYELYLKKIRVSNFAYDYNQLKCYINNRVTDKKLQGTIETFWLLVDETIENMN